MASQARALRNAPASYFTGYSEAEQPAIRVRAYELLRMGLRTTSLPMSPRLRRLVDPDQVVDDVEVGVEEERGPMPEMEAMHEVEDDGGFCGSEEDWE